MATLWAVAALYFDVRISWLRVPLAAVYGLGMLAVWIWIRRPGKMIFAGIGFAVVLTWWFSLPPSNNRDWLPDVALLPYAEINGNQVTVHNIRNCDYRTETDFTVQHYDKTFALDALRTADLYLVTWGSPHIAHTMISFGFTNGDYVCFSIETRKEKGEDYSAVKGLFRQFELTYIIADERDLRAAADKLSRGRGSVPLPVAGDTGAGSGNSFSTTSIGPMNSTNTLNGITRSRTIAPPPSAPSAMSPTARRGIGGCC